MLTNYEVFKLAQFIVSEECEAIPKTIKGYMKVKKLKKELPGFVKDLGDAEKQYRTPSEEHLAYECAKLEIMKPFVLLDEQGNVVIAPKTGEITILEGKEEKLREVLAPFNLQHANDIARFNREYHQQMLEWENFLNNEEALISLTLLNEDEITIPETADDQLFDNLSLLVPSLIEVEEVDPPKDVEEAKDSDE